MLIFTKTEVSFVFLSTKETLPSSSSSSLLTLGSSVLARAKQALCRSLSLPNLVASRKAFDEAREGFRERAGDPLPALAHAKALAPADFALTLNILPFACVTKPLCCSAFCFNFFAQGAKRQI